MSPDPVLENLRSWTRYLGAALVPGKGRARALSASPGTEQLASLEAEARARARRESRAPPPGRPPVAGLNDAALGPAMHVALRRAGDEGASHFQESYNQAAARNLLVLSLARRAAGWLEAEGIPYVALKGISTIARFCGADVAARPLSDADILVGRRDFGRAAALLQEKGLARVKPSHPVTDRWAGAVSLRTRGGGMTAMLDLHQAFHNWPLLSSFSRWVFAGREEVEGWSVPSLPASMLVIAAHRFRHGFGGDARELLDMRWLSAAARDEEWRETIEAAERFDLMPALYVVFRQASVWFGGWCDGEGGEDRRTGELRRRVGRTRGAVLDRLVPSAAGVSGRARLPSGFVGQYLTLAAGMGRVAAPITAMALYTGSRLADEIVTGGRSAFPWPVLGKRRR